MWVHSKYCHVCWNYRLFETWSYANAIGQRKVTKGDICRKIRMCYQLPTAQKAFKTLNTEAKINRNERVKRLQDEQQPYQILLLSTMCIIVPVLSNCTNQFFYNKHALTHSTSFSSGFVKITINLDPRVFTEVLSLFWQCWTKYYLNPCDLAIGTFKVTIFIRSI